MVVVVLKVVLAAVVAEAPALTVFFETPEDSNLKGSPSQDLGLCVSGQSCGRLDKTLTDLHPSNVRGTPRSEAPDRLFRA